MVIKHIGKWEAWKSNIVENNSIKYTRDDHVYAKSLPQDSLNAHMDTENLKDKTVKSEHPDDQNAVYIRLENPDGQNAVCIKPEDPDDQYATNIKSEIPRQREAIHNCQRVEELEHLNAELMETNTELQQEVKYLREENRKLRLQLELRIFQYPP